MGVNMDLEKEPHEVNFPLKLPISIDGELRHRLVMRHYGYDPTMAPKGKSVVVVSFPASYEAWRTPRRVSFENAAGAALWEQHWQNHAALLQQMRECQKVAEQIRIAVKTATL